MRRSHIVTVVWPDRWADANRILRLCEVRGSGRSVDEAEARANECSPSAARSGEVTRPGMRLGRAVHGALDAETGRTGVSSFLE